MAPAAKADDFADDTAGDKTSLKAGFAKGVGDGGTRMIFDHRTAFTNKQNMQGRAGAIHGRVSSTANIGVKTFNLVDQAHFQEKVQGTINRGWFGMRILAL
jgi:hypothetical protein